MSNDASPPPPRSRLTRDRILQAAIALADDQGPQALSMRRLGRALGVEAMSLYNHIAGKDDLLDAIVQYVLGEMEIPTPGEDWREAIRRRARSARQVFARHPWAMGLLESRSADSSPLRLDYYDSVLGSLREAGFDTATAIRAFSIVDSYIFGFILQELSLSFGTTEELDEVGADLLRQLAGSYPALAEATTFAMESGYDRAAEFDFGLDLIIDALERILAGRAGDSR
jgi:AcrR family transcriptional regulator